MQCSAPPLALQRVILMLDKRGVGSLRASLDCPCRARSPLGCAQRRLLRCFVARYETLIEEFGIEECLRATRWRA